MIQFEDKKTDIYQILSFCLGHLKRKIIILLKISLSQKTLSQRSKLLFQLIKQQQICKQYIDYIKNGKEKLIKKQDERYTNLFYQMGSLFQRFICRIKELIRNYLPHASNSHEIFVYLKKIETYSFKSNYVLEDYIVHILENSPSTIEKQIDQYKVEYKAEIEKNDQFKEFQQQKLSGYKKLFNYSNKERDINEFNLNSTTMIKYQKQLDFQLKQKNQFYKKQQLNATRPIDIFNNSIKSLVDCLDCDISTVRSIYFNLQRQKQSLNIKRNFQSTFSNNNKLIKQIQQQMMNQNKYIKQTVKNYDREYSKLQLKLIKDPNYLIRNKKRCQTAQHPKRQFNFSILSNNEQEKQKFKRKKLHTRTDLHKKFQTITHYTSQQQKLQLYKQLQTRKHNILKMKSISISANKGHLQLCAQNKQPKEKGKKSSLIYTKTTGFNSLRKVVYVNGGRNASQNLKKRYDIFLSTNCCFVANQNQKGEKFRTISHNNNQNHNTIEYQSNQDKFQSPTLASKHSKTLSQKIHNHQTIDTLNLKQSNNFISRVIQPHHTIHNHKRYENTPTVFDTLVKNFMKGANVNHRNYTTLQHRQKKIFQTLNPELTVKTIRKS